MNWNIYKLLEIKKNRVKIILQVYRCENRKNRIFACVHLKVSVCDEVVNMFQVQYHSVWTIWFLSLKYIEYKLIWSHASLLLDNFAQQNGYLIMY